MHRHHALLRQIEVQRRENRLLHFACIGRAADQNDLTGEVDRNHRVGAFAGTVPLRIRLERREIENGEFGLEVRKLVGLGADQQRADEQRVPGELGEDAGLDAVVRVGAAVEILSEEFFAFGVGDEVGEQIVEVLFRDFLVVVPPDFLLGEFVDHRVFVFRGAAGVVAGLRAKRAAGDDLTLVALERMLVERGRLEIPVDRLETRKTEFIGAIRASDTGLVHETSSRSSGSCRSFDRIAFLEQEGGKWAKQPVPNGLTPGKRGTIVSGPRLVKPLCHSRRLKFRCSAKHPAPKGKSRLAKVNPQPRGPVPGQFWPPERSRSPAARSEILPKVATRCPRSIARPQKPKSAKSTYFDASGCRAR